MELTRNSGDDDDDVIKIGSGQDAIPESDVSNRN